MLRCGDDLILRPLAYAHNLMNGASVCGCLTRARMAGPSGNFSDLRSDFDQKDDLCGACQMNGEFIPHAPAPPPLAHPQVVHRQAMEQARYPPTVDQARRRQEASLAETEAEQPVRADRAPSRGR
ncbi:MAG: hypothetical protein KatS3mg058_1609 [Roseiflexus sp.]|nr:MAG: hypothetical protein KatS3mg058_1609 [Roseiflexus sp.]